MIPTYGRFLLQDRKQDSFNPVQRDYLIPTILNVMDQSYTWRFQSRPAGLFDSYMELIANLRDCENSFNPVQRDYLIPTLNGNTGHRDGLKFQSRPAGLFDSYK